MVSLTKGQTVSLTKEGAAGGSGGLSRVIVGLGWDEAPRKGFLAALTRQDIDCDASAFLLSGGKLADSADVVYFGNLKHKTGTVVHQGDNLTGAGEGDDEQIVVDLAGVPASYGRIVFAVNIYEAAQRRQDFGMIRNAFVRVVDQASGRELCRYNLSDDYSGSRAVIFGEVARKDGEWVFNAIGEGTADTSIRSLAKRFS